MTRDKVDELRVTARGPRSRRPRADWRLGGRGIHRWNGGLLAWALISCGVAVIVSGLVGRSSMPWAPALSVVVLWAGLGVPVAIAFSRGVPAGLLRIRARDLLWGVCLGIALRLVQGLLSNANSSPFPSPFGGAGIREELAAGTFRVASGLISPLFEEFYFRGVLLLALYQMFRKALGSAGAGTLGALASASLFMGLHLFFAPATGAEAAQLALVGLVCSTYALATGRIWGAVLIHLTYNASFFGLMVLAAV